MGNFFKFQISFKNSGKKLKILAENQKIFKRIARRDYWSNCIVLNIHRWIYLNDLYKTMDFFHISNCWLKTENISKEYRGVNIDQIEMC